MLTRIAALILAVLLIFGTSACNSSGSSSSGSSVRQTSDVTIDEWTDSDGDGLPDVAEQEGWQVTVFLANGEKEDFSVSSDPNKADTDGDGISDMYEKSILTDPRNPDTDEDQLTDSQELNEIYSNPYRQDSDEDGLIDGREFNFHQTSPIFADSDGDQISDSDEVVLATRNPRVADLPSPTIEVGDINLQLDVRFTETTSIETRELESKSVSSTLTQSEKQEYGNTNSNTQEAMAKISVGTGYEVKGNIFGPGGTWKANVGFEAGWTGSWTSSSTATSAQETQNAYQESLTTDAETTEGATVTRSVQAARMQATISIENASDLAYSVRSLQVTAFIQDPQDPTRLTPVATLLPDNEPPSGFNLGPLVPERGPFIFSNDVIFPQLVENLMKNPRGLVFIISNYDISDELGRNFAFSSQEVVERTAALVVDFGNSDSDGDNEGDLTEYHRVATSSGREIDGMGRRMVFDEFGNHLGITLRDALDAIGLRHYSESDTPTSSLLAQEIENSYSTIIDDAGVERIYRVRQAAVEIGVPKAWEILTATGIDQTIGLDDFILQSEDDIKLSYVQDVDQDRMVASLEFVHNCSDVFADTDFDGVDDRTETLIGWEVQTDSGSRQVFSRCTTPDTDNDGLTDAQEAGAPIDCNADGIADANWVTDPSDDDTDNDGIVDREEICGYDVILRNTTVPITVTSVPTNRDTDGDTASDGVERRLGGDPRDPSDIDQFADADGDGLVNYQETEGWDISVVAVSTTPALCVSACDEPVATVIPVVSDPYNADTDGDGLFDGVEKTLQTNPADQDTDNDGLTDNLEVRGFTLRDQGIVVLDPTDADTDNDKRSDGDEAELDNTAASRWIVRVVGQDPYRVYSDPLQADNDYDTVVDGDEYAYGSDPHVPNTDGDPRDDALEIAFGLDPLEVDFRVTVFYRGVKIVKRGDVSPDFLGFLVCELNPSLCGDGEIKFEFDVRRPDDSTATGLSGTPTRIGSDGDYRQFVQACIPRDPVFFPYQNAITPCVSAADGIVMNDGDVFELFDSQLGIPESMRSISFSLTENERFTIEGRVGESDVNPTVYNWVYFGGLDGVPADKSGTTVLGVFEGRDVKAETIEHLAFKFTHLNWNDPSTGPWTAPGEGEILATYIIE